MRRHVADLVTAFDDTLPLEQARTIPSAWYLDPELARLELQAVFGATWQMVGRREQVDRPGAFLTAEVGGEPIMVVRGLDGILRAFINVCRHRAAVILREPCGQIQKLRCRYHGWTYDLEGRLRGTPEFDGVADFARTDHGLPPLAVAEWGPFVWVNLGTPASPLESYLAPLPAWAALRLNSLRFVRRVDYVLRCNWKVYVDNYLDGGYHVNTVHPALAGVLDYSGYKTTLYEYCSVQTSPLKPGDPNDPAGRTRTGDEAAYWWVFPNFMLNAYAGVMDTNLVVPLGPDQCRVIFDYFFAEGTPEDFIEQSIAVAHQVQLEDIGVCEDVQAGLGSRSYSVGRFSVKRELGGYHFHRLLARFLRRSIGEMPT